MKKFSLVWLLKRMHRRIPAILLLVAASAGSAALGVAFAMGTKNVIDTAISGVRQAFIGACLVQFGIILGSVVCLALSRYLTEYLRAVLDRDWKTDILHGLLHGKYVEVAQYHSGELVNRLNNDVRIINEGLISALPNVVGMVVRMIGAFIMLTALEPVFSLLICLVGIAVVLTTGFLRRKLKQLHKIVSEKDGVISAFLQETLEKLLIVQAMDLSGEMERRSEALLQQRYHSQKKRYNISVFANTSLNVMTYVSGFAALVWCAAKLLLGQTTYGTLTAVTQLVSQLQAPFAKLSAVIPQYIAMVASSERLMELEEISREADPLQESAADLYDQMEAISGEHLVFSYDRDRILDGARFRIPKGAFAAITGATGIGKSTLLKLLLGIFHVDEGSLCFDLGSEKLTVDRATRRLFAYVPQGNLLFSGTLRENLLVVKPDATEEELQTAIYVSAMDEYLPTLPKGLDTKLGENGAGLSEGQAQRLAIARAIVSGAPILLMDECTSALDTQTEHEVLQRILSLKNRTCIAVTHRPATLELCSINLEMKDGQIFVHTLR